MTVVIGWNGTGKSNVLEALAIIFRDLIRKKHSPAFAFKLTYCMGAGDDLRRIYIDADPDREKTAILIRVEKMCKDKRDGLGSSILEGEEKSGESTLGVPVKLSVFLNSDGEYLPRYVFSYYSGDSSRMQNVFEPYLKDYYVNLLKSQVDPAPKRLFYALPVHSQFVLLAFLIQPDQKVENFLTKELGIDSNNGVESVLFVLREPPWISKEGDPRFWYARGLVQRFLHRLMKASLAPIIIKRKFKKSIWNKYSSEREYQYLYVKDSESLKKLVGEQPANEFFRDLESTYVSELIEEVRIRVRLKAVDGSVTFRELSEGEQQLLTVLGLLRFTAQDESLFLLDEPDTHLNPRWCVDYLNYLKSFVDRDGDGSNNSHIVLTTHNPLTIAELAKEQVQIFYRQKDTRTVHVGNPVVDPRGMGFANIVTSDMFGLGTSLDKSTNDDLLVLHQLSVKQIPLSDSEQNELVEMRNRLERLDFNFASRDRLEQEYLRARFDLAAGNEIDGAIVTPENRTKALHALMQGLIHNLREGEK